MAAFMTDLEVKEIDDSDWELIEPLHFKSDKWPALFVIPAGFQTDFASVPRVPFAFWLTGDTAHEAAVLHDWLYRTVPHITTRAEADGLLLEGMKVTGIAAWRRWAIYLAVRAGGASSWR